MSGLARSGKDLAWCCACPSLDGALSVGTFLGDLLMVNTESASGGDAPGGDGQFSNTGDTSRYGEIGCRYCESMATGRACAWAAASWPTAHSRGVRVKFLGRDENSFGLASGDVVWLCFRGSWWRGKLGVEERSKTGRLPLLDTKKPTRINIAKQFKNSLTFLSPPITLKSH